MFCGDLQGSVVGLLLFTVYTTPLSSLSHSEKLDHNLYADNTEVYIFYLQQLQFIFLTQPGNFLTNISSWMTNNRLSLNAEKKI